MNKSYSRISILVLILLLVACAPSASQIQTAVAKTQAVLPTDTLANIPEPTSLTTPTKLPVGTTVAQFQETIEAFPLALANMLEDVDGVDSVTMVRPGVVSLEIELRTTWASKDKQPNVSFNAIQMLADVFGGTSEDWALLFVKTHQQHFSILLTTYTIDGDYKYSSLTYYDTLVKLYDKQITYDEWVNEAKAGFVK
jgi:hypothetical protein